MIKIHAESLEQLEQWRAASFFVPVPMVPHKPNISLNWSEQDMALRWHPDPEWVKAGEPCETCGGSGDETMDSMLAVGVPGGQFPIGPCPDCIGGKPRIAITVPCEWCDIIPCHDELCDWDPNPDCTNGRVLVPDVWAVIEHGPLPIVNPLVRNPSLDNQAWIEVYGIQDMIGKQALMFLTPPPCKSLDITDLIAGDPDSLVGTWGCICRVVTS